MAAKRPLYDLLPLNLEFRKLLKSSPSWPVSSGKEFWDLAGSKGDVTRCYFPRSKSRNGIARPTATPIF